MPQSKAQKATRLCFVIGPIGTPGSNTRKQADFLLNGIIREVLEKSPFEYRVQRADSVTEPGMISDQVISAVSEADLVIADLSEHNPNAFYELAIRHMEAKPVIHMISEGYDIPFDIKDYRLIRFDVTEWRTIEEARANLMAQAQALGRSDYVVSNPVTKARGRKQLRESTDSRDAMIADLVESVTRLEQRISDVEDLPPVIREWEEAQKRQRFEEMKDRTITSNKDWKIIRSSSDLLKDTALQQILEDMEERQKQIEKLAKHQRTGGSANEPET